MMKILLFPLILLCCGIAVLLHTSDDQIEKVNMESVYIGYRFGLVYIAKLDALGCQEFR